MIEQLLYCRTCGRSEPDPPSACVRQGCALQAEIAEQSARMRSVAKVLATCAACGWCKPEPPSACVREGCELQGAILARREAIKRELYGRAGRTAAVTVARVERVEAALNGKGRE